MTSPNRVHPCLRPATRPAAALAVVAAAIAMLVPDAAHAQPFPQPGKAIRLLVGFPPGGSTDLLARSVGNKLG